MKRDDITKEKERLMNEVLGKKRGSYNDVEAKDYLNGNPFSSIKETALKEADATLKKLNELLGKQTEQIKKMTNTSDDEFEKLQNEIAKDFGVTYEDKKAEGSKENFNKVEEYVLTKVIGQNEAVERLKMAFRRPFVITPEKGHCQNAMLVMGGEGTGKHAAIQEFARGLYNNKLIDSQEVYVIDMSLYTSGTQESLFLQDLYTAIHNPGQILIIENFETSYAPFLRMLTDLVTKGRIILNKRYIDQKGQLIESQSGLVKNAVNSIQAENQFLIFMTTNKESKVQDAFGQDFMDEIDDKIKFKKFDSEAVDALIDIQLTRLLDQIKNKLKIKATLDDSVKGWLKENYDNDRGVESIRDHTSDFYDHIVECVLKEDVTEIELTTKEHPILISEGKEYDLITIVDEDAKMEAINNELAQIVGLTEVKEYIESLKSHVIMQQRRKKQGLKTVDVSKHMIFTGNPGTGKTTIARLISRYMNAIGVLSKGQLVEVTRADLVGKYVGHTAPLTTSVINSALGGVLFIDEAYSLYRGKDDSFGLEAIDTLVKSMEDHRDDLIVILAGYDKEMGEFLESNSGLKSRFPNIIHFPDYTGEELLAIAKITAKGKEYYIEEKAESALLEYFTRVQEENAMEAGNGRLARNVVEDAILQQSKRCLKDLDCKVDELILEDFSLK